MNQFDQEIRDKLNSKTYNYKPQAWNAFKRHNNMPVMSAGAKVGLFGGIAAAVVGGILFFALPRPVETVSDTAIVAHEPNTDELISTDTLTSTESTEPIMAAESTVAVASSRKQQSPVQKTSEEQTPTQPQATEVAPTQTKPIKKQSTYYGRPLEILVDTISSNDFPDYQAKPADMLP